jgi:hypothetical protein
MSFHKSSVCLVSVVLLLGLALVGCGGPKCAAKIKLKCTGGLNHDAGPSTAAQLPEDAGSPVDAGPFHDV